MGSEMCIRDREKGKWVKVLGWEGPDAARKEITDGIANYARAQERGEMPAE